MQSKDRTISARRVAIISAVLLVLGFLVLMGSILAVAPAPTDERNTISDSALQAINYGVPADVVRRRERVREAIQMPPQAAWAGEYLEGDGLGENVVLSLAPSAGIAATWHGCMGLYGSNEGEVEERDDGSLLFHFNRPNGEIGLPTPGTFQSIMGFQGADPRLSQALAAANPDATQPLDRNWRSTPAVMDFVNAMHRGWEPRSEPQGFFLLAKGDEKIQVSGLPELPKSVLASVRYSPLIGHVSAIESRERVGRPDFPQCRVRIRVRIPDGEWVVPGLEFKVIDPINEYADFRITEGAGTQVLAEDVMLQDCLDTAHMPTTTWILSSGVYAEW